MSLDGPRPTTRGRRGTGLLTEVHRPHASGTRTWWALPAYEVHRPRARQAADVVGTPAHDPNTMSFEVKSRGRLSLLVVLVDKADKIQGNRVKKSICNETCEVVVIPTGDLAADAQGIFLAGRFSSD
jgi:hypothetical protein